MSYAVLLSAICALFAYFFYTLVLHPLYFSPLRNVPFAHPLAITPWWIKYYRRGGSQAQRTIHAAHKHKGPIVRLAPAEISLASYDDAHKVYIERGGFAKPMWWANAFLNYDSRNLVSMVGGPSDKAHATRKRIMGNIYSKSVLVTSPHMRTIASHVLGRLVKELDRVATGRDMGVIEIFNFNAAVNNDFSSAYLFGLSCATNFIENEEQRKEYFQHHGIFLEQAKGFKKAQQWVQNYTLDQCESVRRVEKQGTNASEAVVYKQLTGKGLQGVDLASELLDHLIAGSEAPRTICTYLQWELSKNPSMQSQLRQELHLVLPTSSDELVPDFRALDALPLLDAVLMETLRRWAATPGPQWRITPPEGAVLHGTYVPGGVQIHSSVQVMHRNEDVFPAGEEWKPERWLDADETDLENMRRYFWAFSKGPRACTGKDFTILVMKIFISTLYARYQTEIVEADNMQQDERFLGQPKGKRLVLKISKV